MSNGPIIAGEFILSFRRAWHLSQLSLAIMLGASQNTISQWESGKKAIRNPIMLGLAMAELNRQLVEAAADRKRA